MKEDKITITKLLNEDELKQIADNLVSGEIDNIIVIYRIKDTNSINWMSSISEWSRTIGEVVIAEMMIKDEWSIQAYNNDSEEE